MYKKSKINTWWNIKWKLGKKICTPSLCSPFSSASLLFSLFFFLFLDISIVAAYNLRPFMLISQFFKILKEIFEQLKSSHDLNCVQKCEIFILINIFFQSTKNLNYQVIFLTFNFHGSCYFVHALNIHVTKSNFLYTMIFL